MAAIFPGAVATQAQLWTMVNGISTTLNGAIDNLVTTITVVDTTNFPSTGYFVVDQEIIKYTGKTGTTFTGCTRGSDSSTAVSHITGSTASHFYVADHHNIVTLEIAAIEQNISDRFGLGATSIVIPSAVTSFTINTSLFVVDKTNLRVGIGTAGPTTDFEFSTSSAVDRRFLVWVNNATGNPYINFSTNSTNVSIGLLNSSPVDALIISGASSLGSTQLVSLDPTTGNMTLFSQSNQLVLGTTRTVTLHAPTPGSTSRVVTFPDMSADYSVVATAGTQTIGGTKTFSSDVLVQRASSGGTVLFTVENTSNTASAIAKMLLQVAGATADDAYIQFSISGSSTWSIGLDNSDTDKWKLSKASTLGTSDYISTDGTGSVVFPQGSIATEASSVGGLVLNYIRNTDNTNGASHAALAFYVGGASAGDPWMKFEINGATTVSMGIDNSDGDLFKICATNGLGATGVCFEPTTNNWIPYADNSYSCGKSGNRWSTLWAGNATVQTSHSDFKYDIIDLEEPVVPRGVTYRWKDKKGTHDDRAWVGFIADPLQKECFMWKPDGEIDKTGVSLGAVVGNLCAGWWKHEHKIKNHEERISALEHKKLAA